MLFQSMQISSTFWEHASRPLKVRCHAAELLSATTVCFFYNNCGLTTVAGSGKYSFYSMLFPESVIFKRFPCLFRLPQNLHTIAEPFPWYFQLPSNFHCISILFFSHIAISKLHICMQ